MKVCVCADSHGKPGDIQRILDIERSRALLFLGDGERDLDDVTIPEGVLFEGVCGNGDPVTMLQKRRLIRLEELKVLMTHGHDYHVKNTLSMLEYDARRFGAQVVLFGHTHQQFAEERSGALFLNPGSIWAREQYAVLDVCGQTVCYTLKRLEQEGARIQKQGRWQAEK